MSKLLKERWSRLAFSKNDSRFLLEEKEEDASDECDECNESEEEGESSTKKYTMMETDENAFIERAAIAKSIGADKFEMGDKEYPTTMDDETADEIAADKLEEALRHLVKQTLLREFDILAPAGLEVYDGDEWVLVPDEKSAIEWAKDQLETEFYGRPQTVKFDGERGQYAYLCRYSAEVGSSGPLLVFCDSKEDCERGWYESVADI